MNSPRSWLVCIATTASLGFIPSPWCQTTQPVVLADVGGFESPLLYPVGPLRTVTDGSATWQPATAAPGQIAALNTGDPHGKVLRRTQTGADNIDSLSFPPVSSGDLTVRFDARTPTAGSRTLDVFLLPSTGGEVSLLGWGTVANQLAYYNGTKWVGIQNLDTNWHQIEMINHLDGPDFGTWDLKFDGVLIGSRLPWRNTYPQGTAFSRLRIGGIRGTSGTYAEVDNLVLLGESLIASPFALQAPTHDTNGFRFRIPTETDREYVVERSNGLAPATWQPQDVLTGQGAPLWFTNQGPDLAPGYFRAAKLHPPGWTDGYRGIWFTLGQVSEYGDKYSGGLGTYTANHIPVAIYAPAVNQTFFVYGGTIENQRHLLIMASLYDHATHEVPRPTLVHDKQDVNDPHDNAALALDATGHLWVFVSGRGNARPGFIYRSTQPYSIAAFDRIKQDQVTYPQPWHSPGQGFVLLFTKYTNGRELYWQSSTDGIEWTPHSKLAGIGGHYQVSNLRNGTLGSFFNRHPGGNVDQRTDLYYVQTTNFGASWSTVDGTPLTVPLTTPDNPARVVDYASQRKLVYTLDLNFDTNGHPVILYITSQNWAPGPAGEPRTWVLTRWDGARWITTPVCTSDHNYDMGSLYILPDRWLVIGPSQTGPQPWQTGGEIALWSSTDTGRTWTLVRQLTSNSPYPHTYVRRPLNAADPFFAFWADGSATNLSPSRLYFANSDGSRVWQLPYDMPGARAKPIEIGGATGR